MDLEVGANPLVERHVARELLLRDIDTDEIVVWANLEMSARTATGLESRRATPRSSSRFTTIWTLSIAS